MMAPNATNTKIRVAPTTIDRDRFFPFFISHIANKISRGGSRIYLKLFGIGIIEWRILSVLARSPESTANAICKAIDLDKAAASRSLQALDRLGYVITATDPDEGRKRTVSLTTAGMALHDRAVKVALEREKQLMAGFDAHEREVFLGLLRRMYVNAAEMDVFDYASLDNTAPQVARARREDVHFA